MDPLVIVGLIVAMLVLLVLNFVFFALCYKRCPPNKIMVIFGNMGKGQDGKNRSALCMHGGAKFIMPIVRRYAFLDLNPISFATEAKGALTKDNSLIDVCTKFTVGISVEPEVMQTAAETLLGLSRERIQELATDIILGQLRFTVSETKVDGNGIETDKFMETLACNVEMEIRKIGLRLINLNIDDVRDEFNKRIRPKRSSPQNQGVSHQISD